ncbi:MAG: MlaD family protein [Bacteroidales bacterium]|jgi:phospholipid/cholesterol/gamma-HCH transport system substrate-binding protein
MKKGKEIKVGIISTLVVIAFILAIFFVRNYNIFKKTDKFYTVFSDATGLTKSTPLVLKGINVGQIISIKFCENRTDKVVIKFFLEDNIKIPEDSRILLHTSDILGSKSLQILLGSSSRYAMSGDTLVSEVALSLTQEVGSQVVPLKHKAEHLIITFDTTLSNINQILGTGGKEELINSISNLNIVLENAANISKNLNELIASEKDTFVGVMNDLKTFSNQLANNSDKIEKILTNMSIATDSTNVANLTSTLADLKQVSQNLNDVLKDINSKNGTLGKLIAEDSVYNNINEAIRNLDTLIVDIKNNPGRYVNVSVFGGRKK